MPLPMNAEKTNLGILLNPRGLYLVVRPVVQTALIEQRDPTMTNRVMARMQSGALIYVADVIINLMIVASGIALLMLGVVLFAI